MDRLVPLVVSVCIVSGRRPRQLGACLDSLAAQKDAPPFEVLVASDRDPTVAPTVLDRFPDARVGLVTGSWLGASRNFLIARARGDLLLFLDDDVVVEEGFLARLAATARDHPEAGVFGGPNLTPPGSPLFERLQGAVLGSALGAGPVRRRYGRYRAGPADERWFTLCGMAMRSAVVQPFAVDLTGGEENALMVDLSRAGVAMHYSPDLFVYHERRPDLRSFLSQMRKYGRGRGQLIRRSAASTRPAYLLPSSVVVVLAATPVLALLHPAGLVPAGVYGMALLAAGAQAARAVGRPGLVLRAAGLVAGVHIAYGVGVVEGLLRRRRARAARGTWVDLAGGPAGPEVGEVRP